MRRMLILFSAAALLIAPLTPIGDTSANAVSKYKTKSYRDGGVVLRMSAAKGSVLSPGEEISFTYQASDDALVVLFNIDTEGYVHLLHPYEGSPTVARARETYRVPAGSDKLLVSGETGMEFVFALTIPDRSALDEQELAYLREIERRPLEERYRIDGDPFLAANIIAGELVRGISHRPGVFLDYTYFYVNQRVDHPCYLCGECGGAETALCDDYDLVADLERTAPLAYPLERAYDTVERGVPADEDIDVAYRQETVEPVDEDVNVSFYPYSVEVRYVTRPRAYYTNWYWDDYWYDPFWYDPWYSGYVYYPGWRYPYYGHYYSWSFSWGYWGGYYCSSWYYPRYHHWYDYYHHNYWDYAYGYGGVKYKTAYKERSDTKYKSGSALVSARNQSVKRSNALKIASKDLKRSRVTRVATKDGRTRTAVRSTKPMNGRSVIGKTTVKTRNGRSITSDRTRGSIRGKSSSRIKSTTRSRSGSKSTYTPKSRSSSRKGSAVKRGGTSKSNRKGSAVKRGGTSKGSRKGSAVKRGGSSKGSRKSSAVKRGGSSKGSRKSSSVKRSGSSRKSSSVKSAPSRRSSSSSKSTSKSSSRSGSSKRSGSKGKRK